MEEVKPIYDKYASFGGKSAQGGGGITNTNSGKLFKECDLYNKSLGITAADHDIEYKKVQPKGNMDWDAYQRFLTAMCAAVAKRTKNDEQALLRKICDKIVAKGGPQLQGVTGAVNQDITERMTDTSKYTGAHKQRFDQDGKGRGIEGRADFPKDDGYVSGFKKSKEKPQ